MFVEDAWRQSLSQYTMLGQRDAVEYRRFMHPYIRILRLEDGCETLLAVDPADETTISGFACFNGEELHYVYVKRIMRGLGVARRLLEGRPIRYITHRTPAFESRFKNLIYRPRLAI